MRVSLSSPLTTLLLAGLAACSSDPDTPSGSAGAAGTLPVAGTSGAAAVGGSSAGAAGTNTAGGPAGGTGGSAPTAGSGGMTTPGGAAGAMSAGANAGGASGAGAAGAPSGGTGGSAPTAGSGGQSTLKGGPSGRFVCKAGATYGNPLEGMSAVTTIGPPTSGDVTFFAFIEGPIWVASLGKLFFSDNAGSPERIWSLTPPSTTPELFMRDSSSNGLGLDNEDKLLVCDQREKRITRVDPTSSNPTHQPIASTNGAKPNDLVMRSDGNIYFTDPDMQRGFYRISPSGMVSDAMTQVNNPNGIALSPDENTLYVGDVQNRQIAAFPVGADGSIDVAGMKPFVTAMSYTVDGLAVDCAGNVYASTGQGVEVFSATGMPIGIVPTGESSNATFGGPDRKTLYVTSRSQLKAVTLAVPGLPD